MADLPDQGPWHQYPMSIVVTPTPHSSPLPQRPCSHSHSTKELGRGQPQSHQGPKEGEVGLDCVTALSSWASLPSLWSPRVSTSHLKAQGCRGSQFMSRLGGSPVGPPYLSGPALALGPVPQLSTIKDSHFPLCPPIAPPAPSTTSDKNSCSPKPTA